MKEIFLLYAMSFTGVPYLWGGNSVMDGVDCSGYVQECLAAIGEDPPGDQTAQSLYDYFESKQRYSKRRSLEGRILFFGKDIDHITHVAIALNDHLMIESGGGDSTTETREDAIKRRAMVRVRPISNRRDLVAEIALF